MNRQLSPIASPAISREWVAELDLVMEPRGPKTALTTNAHVGPLRVQRPFYPEADGCCHVYLLHPPGGMVVGDRLQVNAEVRNNGRSLLTTPSAGKIYGVNNAATQQQQMINLRVADGACLEWLPQETIVFDGANGNLSTRVELYGDAKVCAWDIVCLGRRAGERPFHSGRCLQSLEVWRDQQLLSLERNCFTGGTAMQTASWGLQGLNTSGTFLATAKPDRDWVDHMTDTLGKMSDESLWGLTQKDDLFIARFLGNSAQTCRRGFEHIWRTLRPLLNNKKAVMPRIWNT